MKRFFLFFLFLINSYLFSDPIELGVDVFFKEHLDLIKNKKVALIINHTSVNSSLKPTLDLFIEHSKDYKIVAVFSPEHGINGSNHAGEKVEDSIKDQIKNYSLHGKTKRPNAEMLKGIDTIIFDIQEIGSRSYTYATTMFYVMEEIAKTNINFIVLDRPNPMNGIIVDGPMLDEKYRSFVGYINIPYCHGLTIAELANFFNQEYKVGCKLKVIPMKNWKREMSYKDTNLHWIPTSPHIPEPDTPLFYPSTGILGELEIVNIGVGYTLPFKIIGAPWIDANKFANQLNKQNLYGVKFLPFYFKPFYGPFKGKNCQGIKIMITDSKKYRPLAVQYLLIGILKSLYPEKVKAKIDSLSDAKIEMFCKVNGNKEIFNFIKNEKYAAWKMIQFDEEKVKAFKEKKKKYHLY
ncbi:MAG: hypothetical protein K1060chlam5_00803 [Candidatus Anoxychlamydiales bacterium]|nr:hypothetical protein [Candidatus Anoxychlamydiales bacterium]